MHHPTRWHLFDDPSAVAAAAASHILDAARTAIADRGLFRLVLAGGSTPLRTYRLLAEAPADWSGWRIYFGDERCLPPDHEDRNSRAAALAWLDRVAVPRENIHPIPAELGPEAAAVAYRSLVETALPFDLVLLGMGEDGHTASLFPGHSHPSGALTVAVQGAPKPPPERVSLGAAALSAARAVLILVTGAGKREAVAAWQRGEPLPVASIGAPSGVDVLLDREAATGAE